MRTGSTFADILTLPARDPDRRIAYGSDPNQFGELRLPSAHGGVVPVVALIHGGCWESEYDLSHIAPLATAVTALGIACWSIEYRRLGHRGGGWPGTFLDVAAGVDFIRTIPSSPSLDLSHVIFMGHSAGGHLALWAAARSRVASDSELAATDPLRADGVVSLAGISDLRRAFEEQVCETSPGRLVGGAPSDVADRYAAGSPAALLPIGVPQILLHGSRDTIVPASFSTRYAEAARARGDVSRAVIIEGAGHFDLISPESIAWPAVVNAIRELLR